MAINLGGIGARVTGWASGVSWQLLLFKFLACAAILTLVAVGSYREGMHDCQHKQDAAQITFVEQQQATERQFVRTELKRQEEVLNKRLAMLGPQSQEAQQLRVDIKNLQEKVNEAIDARPADGKCAPSDGELQYYEGLAAQSHK